MNPITSLCSCLRPYNDGLPLDDSDEKPLITAKKVNSQAMQLTQPSRPYCQCRVCCIASYFKLNLSRLCRNTTPDTSDSVELEE